MNVSGWCVGAPGSVPQCGRCKSLRCDHACHQNPAVDRDSAPKAVEWSEPEAARQRRQSPGSNRSTHLEEVIG